MKNRLLYLAVVGLPVLVSLSCSKDEPPPLDQISDDPLELSLIAVDFSNKALEYVQLTEGTLLVYRDSATSIVDTVMVTKSSLEKMLYPEREINGFGGPTRLPAQNADHFLLILTRMMSGTQDGSWFEGEASAFYDFGIYSIDNAELNLQEVYLVNSTLDYQRSPAFDYSEPYSGDLITVTVEGSTYQNVLVFDTGYQGDINNPIYRKATYYWAKGVGIIKRRIVTTGGLVKTSTLVSSN